MEEAAKLGEIGIGFELGIKSFFEKEEWESGEFFFVNERKRD